MLQSMFKRLRLFREDTRGYVTIEVMISLPILLILFGTSWTFFDAFRQQSISQKANYTIGDMLSRETMEIDDEYINNVQRLFYVMTKTGGTNNSDIRITVVSYDSFANEYSVEWSEARGDHAALDTPALRGHYLDRLPVMAHADQLILVETWDRFDPAFTFAEGLTSFDIQTYSFTRPRFTPQIIQVNSADNADWNPDDYEPQIPDGEGEGMYEDERRAWEEAQNQPVDPGCTDPSGCTNNDGSNNTGGGGGDGDGVIPVTPTTGTGGSDTGGSDGSDTGGSGSDSGTDNTGSEGTYTPPPPPPPPPPTPPGAVL